MQLSKIACLNSMEKNLLAVFPVSQVPPLPPGLGESAKKKRKRWAILKISQCGNEIIFCHPDFMRNQSKFLLTW